MAEHQSESLGFGDKHYFLIRRIHSLTGLVPVGIFLCIHLSINASILLPGEPGHEFQRAVERIHALGPLLKPVEIVGIFIPLAFHALLGFQIIFIWRSNTWRYRYGSNIRYTLQRATGMIAAVFILYHVWQMHWLGLGFGGGEFQLHDESGRATGALTTATLIQQSWWMAPLYGAGIIAAVFHLANGIWTSLITWGITVRPKTQRGAGYVCTAFGIVLALVGLGALNGFKRFDTQSQPVAGGETPSSHATH